MDEIQPPSGPITLVVSDVVELSQVTAYEAWTAGINHDARQFEGFLEGWLYPKRGRR